MQRLMQNGALQTEGTPSMGAPSAIGYIPTLLMAIKASRPEEQSNHRRSDGRTYAEGGSGTSPSTKGRQKLTCSKTECSRPRSWGLDMDSASKKAQEESRACSPGLEPDRLPV